MRRLSYRLAVLILLVSACSKNKDDKPDSLPAASSCQPVAPASRLSFDPASGKYTYQSTGGSKVVIDMTSNIILTTSLYEGFKIEFWGDYSSTTGEGYAGNHENLNGKHIKDRKGLRRSVMMPDGLKITLVSKGPGFEDVLESISIIDGNSAHYINMICGKLNYSGNSAALAEQLDNREADGETSTIEMSSTGLLWVNIYQEDAPGVRMANREELGELNRANPTQVRDYYDDPRLGHT